MAQKQAINTRIVVQMVNENVYNSCHGPCVCQFSVFGKERNPIPLFMGMHKHPKHLDGCQKMFFRDLYHQIGFKR